jgi:urocanate hydratase
MSYESFVKHVSAMNDLYRMGAVVFEFGNQLRKQAQKGGLDNAFQFPSFVEAYIYPLYCAGMGSSRWTALSGDPNDIYRIDQEIVDLFPRLKRWIKIAQQWIPFQGLPARICWLGHDERAKVGIHINQLVRKGELKAPIIIGRAIMDAGANASPDLQTENLKDGSDMIGDWPILKGLLNVASGATIVAVHSTPGSYASGMAVVADGTDEAQERIWRSLTADTGFGVIRFADAGYEPAVQKLKGETFSFF